MTTSQQSRLGDAPEEGIKAPVVTISSGQEALFDVGQSIAGVVIADQDRVCINAQTDPLENGIYIARAGKDWERATDMNSRDDVQTGQLLSDENTAAVYSLTVPPGGWTPGLNSLSFGLLLSPVGFFWGAITGTLSNQADLQAALDAKAALVHTHVEADITDLQAYLLDAAGSIAMDGELYLRQDAAWVSIDFSVFAPAIHTHVEADITDLQPYLLDAAGSIANNNELYARANNGWQAFSTSSGTTGEVIGWPHDEVPQNFLECDGQSINAVTFADLFAVIGYKYGGSGSNFNLPDLRGEFLRGWDHGRGADPDAASRTDRGDGGTGNLVGTKQAAAVGPHAHTYSAQQAIGGFTDNGGAPDQRSTQQNANTGTTGSGIGGDTRGRNVQLMYIIRYTGGGSGITQPPSIEVQDGGVTLTTAVQLLNFINFNVTEPLDDQIDITFGSSRTSGEYCPGYPPVFLTTTSFRIDNFDVTLSYRPGRRLRFIDGASNYYGTILTSTFTGGNTDITMSMDTGLLTASISEVCFTTSASAWSPISADPFAGNSINDITSGAISAVDYTFAVGHGGRAGWSTDGGLTWTMLTTGTTENLNVCEYDSNNEVFWMGGDAGVIVSWDGSSVTLDTTSIPALSGTENDNINALTYSSVEDAVIIVFLWGPGAWATASTDDQGATWNVWDTDETGMGANKNATAHATGSSQSGPGFITARSSTTAVRTYTTHDDVTASNGANSTPNGQIRNYTFWDATQQYIIADTANRIIASGGQWTGFDDANITELVKDFAYSSFHDRLVLVGENCQLAYWDGADKTLPDAWVQVATGFDPLVTINCVHWDPVEGHYIAASANGQICRSSTGLGDFIPAVIFSGWTAIAADPFSGGNIDHIATGVIAGTQWWVIASSTLIFTSTDAGITWISRTSGVSGSITDLKYDSTNEAFVAVCSNGDFTRTTDGSTWTADTTTVQAIGGLTGSGSINSLVWSPAAGTWWAAVEYTVAVAAGFEVSADLTTWTIRDTSTTAGTNPPNTTIYDPSIAGRTIYTGITQSANWYTDPTDTSPTSINNMSEPVTAMLGKTGTLGDPQDMFIGDNAGDIELMSSTSLRAVNNGAMAGPVNAFAYSSMSDRMIAVGNAGEIKTQAGADFETLGTWKNVTTPFGSNINDVDYNATDDMFVCVCADGTIARSVDGIS